MKIRRFVISALWLIVANGVVAMNLTSSAFTNNGQIPERYTCHDQDITPPLQWSDVPQQTKSLALMLSDPDAPSGTWEHWLIFNLSKDSSGLPENLKKLPDGAEIGLNSWGKMQYNGPCPPSGEHRYVFRLYALDTLLNLPGKIKRQEFEAAIKGHVLATAELLGRVKAK